MLMSLLKLISAKRALQEPSWFLMVYGLAESMKVTI
jgi:hypothetical protein